MFSSLQRCFRPVFRLCRALHTIAWVILVGLCLLISPPLLLAKGASTPLSWRAFQEPKYGAVLYYPANWFHEGVAKNGGFEFASSRGDGAVLFLKTSLDPLRTGAAATVQKLKSGTGAHRIKDIQSGETWYELRLAPRPGLMQVTRVLFTCKERIVSAVTLIYPAEQAEAYEAMLKKLKKRFSVGVGTETPVRSCS